MFYPDILRALGYLWALPHTLIGLLLVPLYRPTRVRWSEGCLEMIAGTSHGRTRIFGKPWAQTHGWLIFYAGEEWWSERSLRVHERVHVTHGFIGGPFYVLSYILHFAWLFAFTPTTPVGKPRWKRAYLKVWSERIAYRTQDEFADGKRPDAWGSRP